MWSRRCCCSDPEDPPCAGFFAGNKTYARVSYTIATGWSNTYTLNKTTGELDGSSCEVDTIDSTESISASESITASITFVVSYEVFGSSRSTAYVSNLSSPTLVEVTSSNLTGSASYAQTIQAFSNGSCTSKRVISGSGTISRASDNTSGLTTTDCKLEEREAPVTSTDGSVLAGCVLEKCRIVGSNFDNIGINYTYSGTGTNKLYTGQECDTLDEEEDIGESGSGTWMPSVDFATVGGATDCTDQATAIPNLLLDYGQIVWSTIRPLSKCLGEVDSQDAEAAISQCETEIKLQGGSYSKQWRDSESLDEYQPCPGQAPRFIEGDEEAVTNRTESFSINSITFTDSAP